MSIQPTDSAEREHFEVLMYNAWEEWAKGTDLRNSDCANFEAGFYAALASPPAQAQGEPIKLFKTSVLGIGPYCVEFSDGEIVYTRSKARQKAIGALYTPLPARAAPTDCGEYGHAQGACGNAACVAPLVAPQAQGEPTDGMKLWLWKDGSRYLAYRHLYPCYSPGGDPMTLGEPFAEAEFRSSHDRDALLAATPPAVQPVPFGFWHQGETDEESEFFLYSESGDVRCVDCVALYATPPAAQAAALAADPVRAFLSKEYNKYAASPAQIARQREIGALLDYMNRKPK